MNIVHISPECYPIAKAGGLGDVVGALPKYQTLKGSAAKVVIPKYDLKWFDQHELDLAHESRALMGDEVVHYKVYHERHKVLGFDLYAIEIIGRFDRPGIYIDPNSGYAYWDEFERSLSFQVCAIDWINSWYQRPDVIHCHDHNASLIPFMMRYSYTYQNLHSVPSVVSIHNGEYQGNYDLGKAYHIPNYNVSKHGLLEWYGRLNFLAAGIKSAWAVTTVSPTYLQELKYRAKGLEELIHAEEAKMYGILNGIDTKVWDSECDPLINHHYHQGTLEHGKQENKNDLCSNFNLPHHNALVSFIGRLVGEKGADLLPDLVRTMMHRSDDLSFLILGTGDPELHNRLNELNHDYPGRVKVILEYNEQLAHQMYAGSDFLLMPSRVEPCGLNQMYALRYGTIPVVRRVGGLNDTVVDISQKKGTGILFNDFNLDDAAFALSRAITLYKDEKQFQQTRQAGAAVNHSWEKSAQNYLSLYKKLMQKVS